MPDFTFAPAPVLVETTGEFAIGATGVLRATEGGDPVQVYDLNDSPLPSITVGPKGAHQAFKADISDGVLDFESVLLPSQSLESQRAGLEAKALATAAAANAQTALTLIEQLAPGGGTGGALTVYGTGVDATNLPDGTIVIELPEGTV